jgi:hypothetical protein
MGLSLNSAISKEGVLGTTKRNLTFVETKMDYLNLFEYNKDIESEKGFLTI